MGDFTVNVRQKPMDFNRWQLGLSYESCCDVTPITGNLRADYERKGYNFLSFWRVDTVRQNHRMLPALPYYLISPGAVARCM
jgi:hypothetical protein